MDMHGVQPRHLHARPAEGTLKIETGPWRASLDDILSQAHIHHLTETSIRIQFYNFKSTLDYPEYSNMDSHPAVLNPTPMFFMHSAILTERIQSEASVVAKLEKELAAKVAVR